MTLLLPLLLFLVCAQARIPTARGPLRDPVPPPSTVWFTQKFDHFGSDQRTFQQRYLIYDKFYNGSGPIFFCPGGESDVSAGYNHNGLMFEYGSTLGALLLFPEHRFYGQTLPSGPVDSYLPANVAMLTIAQALADYVAIIAAVRAQYKVPPTTPLIAFGGSYPGELAAFMRYAYPDVVDGALAASAPIRYHQGILPPVPAGAFFKVVTDVYAAVDPRCPDLVRTAMAQIADAASSESGRAQLSMELGLCTPLASGDAALRLLNLWVENAYALIAMINYPYATGGFAANPMTVSCQNLLDTSTEKTLLQRLASAVGVAYNNTGALTCFNITDEYYPCADITGCGGGVGDPDAMSWDYQSCTEIVSNVDTNNVTDMFPAAPYDWAAVVDYCQRTWGTTPRPLAIPTTYNITASSTSRIIFSNGLIDPWWPGGVLTDLSQSIPTILIEDAAHHLDLRGTTPSDPPAVLRAREQEKAIISDWLQQAWAERAERHRAVDTN